MGGMPEGKGTIVVVDDEANIADLVDLYLAREGFRVLKAGTGEAGLQAVRNHRPRLVVLDVGLPDVDGLEVCKRVRATSQIPVIFLTARDGEVDRVLGLELGADDYLTKPFSPAELVARVKAVLRRTDGGPAPEVLQAGGTTVDVGRREVRVDDEPVELTTKEFDLLRYLAERPGLALSRKQILDGVWGYDWFGDARTVDVHIAQVRKKLGNAVTIKTVRGVGYRLESQAAEPASG
jgi:DNA-binding response OmpR family regulator